MANAIQRYVANKACCIATNVQKTDNKIKYGAEDMICCINKDFIANVFLEILMCNSVATDATWYVLNVTSVYLDNSPSSFPTSINVPSASVISSDGTFTAKINAPQIVTATSILDFNIQLYDIFKAYDEQYDPSLFIDFVSIDESTGEAVFKLYYTSKWGDITNVPRFDPAFNTAISLTQTITSTSSATSVNSDNCLSESQLCDIKNWLDEYCQSC